MSCEDPILFFPLVFTLTTSYRVLLTVIHADLDFVMISSYSSRSIKAIFPSMKSSLASHQCVPTHMGLPQPEHMPHCMGFTEW